MGQLVDNIRNHNKHLAISYMKISHDGMTSMLQIANSRMDSAFGVERVSVAQSLIISLR
jgi:hypothetical protein